MQGLVEREQELASLTAAIGRAAGGEGATVLLEGSAGIGKSRLLAAAEELAAEAGLTCFTARGGELERDFAHGLVRQLLERPVVRADAARRRKLLAGAAGLAA